MRVEAEFAGDVGTVRLACRFVAGTLAGWNLDHLKEVACLLTSELVANAVRYVGDVYRLVVEWKLSELQIQVIDRSPYFLVYPRPPSTATPAGASYW